MISNRRNFLRLSGLGTAAWLSSPILQANPLIFTQSGTDVRAGVVDGLYNLNQIPYSLPESFLKLTALNTSGKGRIMLATCRNISYIDFASKDQPFNYYELALLKNGEEQAYEAGCTPWETVLSCAEGTVRLSFSDADTLVFVAEGVELRLLPVHSVAAFQWVDEKSCSMTDFRGLCIHQIRAGDETKFTAEVTQTVNGTTGPYADKPYQFTFSGSGTLRGAIRLSRFGLLWKNELIGQEQAADKIRVEWQSWLKRMPVVSEAYQKAAEAAWYINWSSQIGPVENYSRRSMLMSKNWMNQVWSWDNCFNALAMARADKELAFDQLRLFFDKQTPEGMFPDTVNETLCRYGFVKPPIYGWTLIQLMKLLPPEEILPFIKEAYDPLRLQVEWWYSNRDPDGNGMCEYLHGNDSGWDNGSMFDQGYPTEGVDLAAHLTLQMEALSRMCELLGRRNEASGWNEKARQQMAQLLKRTQNNRFFSPLRGKNEAQDPECLLNYIPLELGHRLPKPIYDALTSDLMPGGKYLTQFGLATQAHTSAKYKEDGYWRGPIWAPSTYLIFTGLIDGGVSVLANDIAERFCKLGALDGAMWENYEAKTGKGLQCPGYTWTSSVYLLLAEHLHNVRYNSFKSVVGN